MDHALCKSCKADASCRVGAAAGDGFDSGRAIDNAAQMMGVYPTFEQAGWHGLVLVVLLMLAGCGGGPERDSRAGGDAYGILQQQVPVTARRYLGQPYRWGGDPDQGRGSDCSNLVSAVTRNALGPAGYRFTPHYLNTTGILANSHAIRRRQVRVGDLMMFAKEKGGEVSDHVGVVTSVRDGAIAFAHASSSRGVIITTTDSNPWTYYWQDRFHSYRRWDRGVFSAGTG